MSASSHPAVPSAPSVPPRQVREILARTGMPRYTAHTITDPDELAAALQWSREHGYALDDGEQEMGVRCVAVAVPDVALKLAISISGPATWMTNDVIERAVPILSLAGAALSADLA